MEVVLGVSNRHVHLTKEDYQILFGNSPIKVERFLLQKGEFASDKFVTLKNNARILERVRIIGPFRTYTQVELSKTDARYLKLDPPVRSSGILNGASTVTMIGPCGQITKPCAILANRHIHINQETRKKLGLFNIEKVRVSFKGKKETIFEDVFISERENGVFEMHLDTDDANGALLTTGDKGTILLGENK